MPDDVSAVPLCRSPHLHHLLDAEHRLRTALSLAREQMRHAECVLEQIAIARQGSPRMPQQPVPSFMERGVTLPERDDEVGDPLDAASPVGVSAIVLTARETEVLAWIAAGLSNRRIAEVLYLSPRTIERHIANLYLKLDVHTKAEATAWALVHGLVGREMGTTGSVSEPDACQGPENYICRLHRSTDA